LNFSNNVYQNGHWHPTSFRTLSADSACYFPPLAHGMKIAFIIVPRWCGLNFLLARHGSATLEGIYMRQSTILRRLALISTLGAASAVTAGAALAAEPAGMTETAQRKAYEITGKDVATIKFDVGGSTLTAYDQSELRAMYHAVRDNARVREIVIAAYSDLPYPSGPNASQPGASRRLAEKRANEVKKFMSDLGAKSIRVVNMAHKANWFERTFDTKDALIKSEAAEKPSKATADDLFYEALGAHLHAAAGPSDVVVVIRHD